MTILSSATVIRDLADPILRPHLYDHHGNRLCDFGRCKGLAVTVIDGEHMCAECASEVTPTPEPPFKWWDSYKEDEEKERRGGIL